MFGKATTARCGRGRRGARTDSGQVLVLLLVVLAILAGGWWLLRSSRAKAEKDAWSFANEAAKRIVLQQDVRFLDQRLSQKAQLLYPPSWRFILLARIRETGTPEPRIEMKGEVLFTSQFFEPMGVFRAAFQFPTGPAYLDLQVSHPKALWQIDGLNWTWQQPPPPPTPTPTATPSPTPSPSAKPRPRRPR